jgi:hypothetical protein
LTVLVKQNILLLTIAVKLFIHFNAQHEENVPETALSEFFGRNTVKTYHSLDVIFVGGSFSGLKLNELVEKNHSTAESKQLDGIKMLLDFFIKFLL